VVSEAQYVARGIAGIRAVLEEQSAVVWPEVEARLSDYRHTSITTRVDPHHLTTAKSGLLKAGFLRYAPTVRTRGGREISILQLGDETDRQRRIADAAARKRLLYARYLGWSSGTDTKPGIIGPGLETVLHASLLKVSPFVGLRIENPVSGDTSTLAGVELPADLGSLDNGATWIDPNNGRRFAYPMEAKNLRDWLYPTSQEVFQLLEKAAYVAMGDPKHEVVPVLVCRRVQKTLVRMAADLGFHVIDVKRQYILPTRFKNSESENRKLHEVRSGLGFLDLTPSDAPDDTVIKQFRSVLPAYASRRADRWRTYGMQFMDLYPSLRRDSSRQRRSDVVNSIRQAMRGEPNPYDGERDADRGW
jgi:hypothetical protein